MEPCRRAVSLKLCRDLRIAQSSTWFMLHRIQKGVEVDETYVGGKRKNTGYHRQMAHMAAGMVGRLLLYRDLTADNGRSAVAS